MRLVLLILLFIIGSAVILISVKLTVFIETPVIVKGRITENKEFIEAINTFTNVLFNLVLVFIACMRIKWFGYYMERIALILWYVFGEAILIPLGETFAYKKISKAPLGKIILLTYLANALSFILGTVFFLAVAWLLGFRHLGLF